MEQEGIHTDGCRVNQFERNRYFHGKLMTARDMEAEQRYHATRLNTLARYVIGDGIVCGLEATVTESDGVLEVAVEPGMAIDCCGRPIIVENTARETFGMDTVQEDEGVSVYLRFAECVKESVPIPGSENACEERCTYNRVAETVEITIEAGSPKDNEDLPGGKRARVVRFPANGKTGAPEPEEEDGDSLDDREDQDEGEDDDGDLDVVAVCEIARSYLEDDDGVLRACDDDCDGRVFLGFFRERNGGRWRRVRLDETGGEPRPHVYNNDMLYAALSQHTADFGNPHQVSLEVLESDRSGAFVTAEDQDDSDGAVRLHSPNGTIEITAQPDRTVEFELSRALDLDGVDVDELREMLSEMSGLEDLARRSDEIEELLERRDEIDDLLDVVGGLEGVPDRLDEIEERLGSVEEMLARLTEPDEPDFPIIWPPDFRDPILDIIDIHDHLIDLAEHRDGLVTLADLRDPLVTLTDNQDAIVSLAGMRDPLVSLADTQDRLIRLADREQSIVTLADNENTLTSLAANRDSLVNLATKETQLVSLADNQDSIISLADNRETIFREFDFEPR